MLGGEGRKGCVGGGAMEGEDGGWKVRREGWEGGR